MQTTPNIRFPCRMYLNPRLCMRTDMRGLGPFQSASWFLIAARWSHLSA